MFDSKHIPIGIDDFGVVREQKLLYVDKTFFIKELIDHVGVEVFLFPRPRRFGKTLAMTMLRYYFEKSAQPRSAWFEGLCIWNAGPAYRAHHQKYPVIFITLKDVKKQDSEGFFQKIRSRMGELYQEHRVLLEGNTLSDVERRHFLSILDGTASLELCEDALFNLSHYLHRAHGEKVILLIDEYDTAIHEAYLHGFAEPVINFFRNFLGKALKSNSHLYKAVLTGILRISKESIFSDLNHLSVYSILRSNYATVFGFTESETSDILAQAGLSGQIDTVRAWYNGYIFGGQVMYNPWSLLNFMANGGEAMAYWVNTSANSLIKEMLIRHTEHVGPAIETLLSGGEVRRELYENTALGDLETDDDVLFSLLTFSGYLKARALPSEGQRLYGLSIPNREVREVYISTFKQWLKLGLVKRGASVEGLCQALLSGEAEELEDALNDLAQSVISYQDRASQRPEFFYHGFVLGLLATLEPEYRVRSNRESGKGRPDVMVLPVEKGKVGVVLELKVAKPRRKTLDQALDEGEAQMKARGYEKELEAVGVSAIVALVLAFDGKSVRVRRVEL